MIYLREKLVVGAAIGIVVLGLVGRAAWGREVKLVVRPQKVSAEAGKYALLPPAATLVDGDAVSWYEKAVRALPDKAGDRPIQQWLKMPIAQLPADAVEQALTAYMESLKGVARAVKCRECRWPSASTPGAPVADLGEYRRLALAIGLWVRYEISQENYEGAALALQTGLGMGRHLTQAPTLLQLVVGNAVAAVMFAEVEEFVQGDDAPNLYAALAALPRPFADVEKVVESERKAIPSEPPAGMTRAQFESELERLEQSYDRVRLLGTRLDAYVASLQCVEAIRAFAASHDGRLPQALAEITEVSVPKDPTSGESFRYTRTGATAALESAPSSGGGAKYVTRYEIAVKN